MPSEGEKLDELLSGLLDGELSSDELKAANAELEDAQTRDRLTELTSLSRDVRAAFQAGQRKPATPSKDLVASVIASARLQASQADLPADHPIVLGQASAAEHPTVGHSSSDQPSFETSAAIERRSIWGRVAIAASVLAATVLIAFQLPGVLNWNSSPKDDPVAVDLDTGNGDSDTQVDSVPDAGPLLAEGSNAAPAADPSSENLPSEILSPEISQPKYVSGMNFKQTVVMVVDIELSSTAKGAERFDEVLRKHGLLRDEPVMAGDEIANAVSETRMMVRPEEDARASEATIYFVRSDFRVLGAALDELYFDKEAFPNLSFSLAVDNPMVRLVEKIAQATGQRFLANQAFAVPVLGADDSPFGGLRKPTRLVSAKERQQGFSGGMAQAFSQKGQLNSILFFVR